MRGLNTDFRFVGDSDELAVIVEDGDQQFIAIVENPQVTEVTCTNHGAGDIEIASMNGERFQVRQEPQRVIVEVAGILKEEIVGENAEEHIPDIVDDMSVEELLRVVNSKLQESGV